MNRPGISTEEHFVTEEFIRELEGEMLKAAEQLDFERAARIRDRIHELKKKTGQPLPEESSSPGFAKKGQPPRQKTPKTVEIVLL